MRRAIIITILASVSLLGSCGSTSELRVANVAPAVELVVGRHDAYVAADTFLDETTRAEQLAQSAALVGAVSGVSDYVAKAAVQDDLLEVVDRHDAYVGADDEITALRKRLALRTTEQIRDLFR